MNNTAALYTINKYIAAGSSLEDIQQAAMKSHDNTAILIAAMLKDTAAPFLTEVKTFDEWKREGFSVKKGEHASLSCMIWIPCKMNKQQKAAAIADGSYNEEADRPGNHFTKKMTHFFTRDQVTIPTQSGAFAELQTLGILEA